MTGRRKKKKNDLPEIKILFLKKRIKITGFKDFEFTEQAYAELKVITDYYTQILKENNGEFEEETLDIIIKHLQLWSREKIDKRQIARIEDEGNLSGK